LVVNILVPACPSVFAVPGLSELGVN